MNEGLIARRYAKALYKVALEQGSDKRVYGLMKTLSASFDSNSGLQEALANPFVGNADKKSLIVTASGATAADTLIADFVKMLEHNHRMEYMREIALAYIAIYREAHKIYLVHVDTAAPMAEKEAERLKGLIASHLGQGASMEYSSAVVPDLIGGFRVSVGNERLDASVANELKQLRLRLIK